MMKILPVITALLLASCSNQPLESVEPDRPPARAEPIVDVAFDTSRNQIEISGRLAGAPAVFLVDTGLNPSGFGIASLRRAGIAIDEATRFEIAGVGSDLVYGYEARVDRLEIGGVTFDGIEAVADTGPIFTRPGRQLDGVLGYSFLQGKVVMFDYVDRRFRILRRAEDAEPLVGGCALRHDLPLSHAGEDTIPVFHEFDFGGFHGPVSLDTGSSFRLTFYADAVERLSGRLQEIGSQSATGARGATSRKRVVVNGEMGFGPFRLRDFEALVGEKPAAEDPRFANMGNRFLSDLKMKAVLDYPSSTMSFFGQCAAG